MIRRSFVSVAILAVVAFAAGVSAGGADGTITGTVKVTGQTSNAEGC